MVGQKIVEQFSEVASQVVVIQVTDDLTDEINEYPLRNVSICHCILKVPADSLVLELY